MPLLLLLRVTDLRVTITVSAPPPCLSKPTDRENHLEVGGLEPGGAGRGTGVRVRVRVRDF